MQIERVTDPGVLEAIYRLRVTAWRARVPAFPDIGRWSDEYDADALHWAAFDRGAPVAAARLTVHDTLEDAPDSAIYKKAMPEGLPLPVGVFGRLCVAPGYGGLGLARMLDDVRIDFARRMGCECVVGITTSGAPRLHAMSETGFDVIAGAVTYESGPLATIKGTRRSVMLRRLVAEGCLS